MYIPEVRTTPFFTTLSLQRSYTLLAPLYDTVVGWASRRARAESLQLLQTLPAGDVFLDGVGTGLDLPYLPPRHRYAALDLTRAMLVRALPRTRDLDVAWIQGNSEALPFPDSAFDCAVLHLIVAVVAHPDRALMEAARVVRRGGTLLVLDKFLARGSAAPVRRLLSPLVARIATRTDVELETLLEKTPCLRVIGDTPALAGGWFRRLVLEKK